jgi:transposase
VLEYRTLYGVLQAMARELRGRGVTHVVMEASGVYTEPVYYALAELDFTEVLVVNPAHVKALKGRKTDAKDAVRLLDLYECGAVMRGSYIPMAGWLGAIGPAPHQHFATAQRLASWVTLCPGNYISARKSRSGRTGDGGNYIKPLLVQAAWAAIRVPGRLQARFHRLVRKFGGPKNKGAKKRAIIAIAHTLLKIAYAVLKTGRPYQEPGTDFYTRRDSGQAREDYLLRQLRKLRPGCVITITPAETA